MVMLIHVLLDDFAEGNLRRVENGHQRFLSHANANHLSFTIYSSVELVSMSIARQAPYFFRSCSRVSPSSRQQFLPSALHTPIRHHAYTMSTICSRTQVAFERGPCQDYRLFPRARRRFSASAVAMHGHLTPPKPGEE